MAISLLNLLQTIELAEPTDVSSIHLIAAGESAGGFLKGESKEKIVLNFAGGHSSHVDMCVPFICLVHLALQAWT